jgi:hypothetical protein
VDNSPAIETAINAPFLQNSVSLFPKGIGKLASPFLWFTIQIELASGSTSGT